MIKLYPSSLTFAIGDVLDCEYNSACILYQYLQDGRREEIPAIYQEVGAKWEDIIEAKLLKEGCVYEKEKSIRVEVMPGITLSGRIDYYINDIIIECKAGIGKNFHKKIFDQNTVKTSHLAQVACYFLMTGKTRAKIMAGYFTDKLQFVKSKVFKITLESSGELYIDKIPSGRHMGDLIAALSIHKNQVIQRPYNYTRWDGPCKFCRYNGICTSIDNGVLDLEEAKKEAKNVIIV
jgi:hypothetical protein